LGKGGEGGGNAAIPVVADCNAGLFAEIGGSRGRRFCAIFYERCSGGMGRLKENWG
jgi:hypothetical protein